MWTLDPGHCRLHALTARGRCSLQTSFEVGTRHFQTIEVRGSSGLLFAVAETKTELTLLRFEPPIATPWRPLRLCGLARQEMPSLSPLCIPGSPTALRLLGE